MKVSAQCVVELTWVLKDGAGDVLDELLEPVAFLVGADDLLPAIDAALQGKSAGDSVLVQMDPHDAFGDYDEQLVFLEPRSAFPGDIEPGMIFEGLPEGCNPQAPAEVYYMVSDVYADHVVMDGNHPLAGMALHLDAKLHAVREATEEEVGSGTAGAGFFKLGSSHGPSDDDTVH
jgi:FKBP-type peptidyl-prolyl cis-trans isomerase SlyD